MMRTQYSAQSSWHTAHGRRSSVCYLLSAICCLLTTGCSALTHLRRHPGASSQATAAALLTDGYEDYVGVIHIHTAYSHDAQGTIERAIRVANAQQLNYIIITEHNTLQPLRDGWQGWHGAVLVLIGDEISTRAGHYLALNVSEEIDRSKLTAQQIIDAVNRQGGFGFIAHPYFKKRRWTDWTVTGFTGIEGYNTAHDTLDENRLRLALWTLTAPAESFYLSIINRPYDPLAKWDELMARHGRVVGIGASDAHEIHLVGMNFAPYEIMFQLSRTHALIPSTTLTRDGIYDALRRGHVYFSIELMDEAKGFSFLAEADGRVVGIMGDEVPLAPDLRLNVSLSQAADLTLLKDGQVVSIIHGRAWQVPVTSVGAYRLEAMRDGRPWIFSNPIYVRPAEQQTAGNR